MDINIDITKEAIMKEHRTIHDLLEDVLKRTRLSHAAIKSMRESAKKHAKETTEVGRSYSYNSTELTEIKKKEKLLKYSTARNCGWSKYGVDKLEPCEIGNTQLQGNYDGIFNLIQELMARQECLLRVSNEFLNIDQIQAKADMGSEKAYNAYRRIMTNLPYRWGNLVVKGNPKRGGDLQIKWKQEEDSYYDRNSKFVDKNGVTQTGQYINYINIVPKKITYFVDDKYMDTVVANDIETCDIAGKKCFTVSAEEQFNHGLETEGVRLFKAKVGYTKIPVDFEPYAWGSTKKIHTKADMRGVIYCEERWIAVQDQNGKRIQMATGKDKSWAIRTMKQRMKTSMLKQMGLK